MSDKKAVKVIECVLCRKPKNWNSPYNLYENQICEWSKVCRTCEELWELGKKTMAATKADGKGTQARVYIHVPTHAKMGDALGPVEVDGKDIMRALGGVSLRGTAMGGAFRGPGRENIVSISSASDPDDNLYISGGGSLDFKVPKERAEAMKRVIVGFFNAIAKARVDGFNEGRNLLLGLAHGHVSLESFSEQADNARVGKKPKRRGDD